MSIDFLVVGGGIAGVSAAARLAPLGKTVVVEAEDALAYHASGRSAALYEPNYGAPTVRDLSLAGQAHFEGTGVLSPRGILMVGKPGEEAAFRKEAEAFGMDEISLEEAAQIVPILDLGALKLAARTQGARDIDTDLLIQNFARDCRAHGGAVRVKTPVSAINRKGGGWEVTAGPETLHARVLVNAAGAWADQVAQMAGLAPMGLQPNRRSMARIPAPGGHDTSRWPMLFGVGETWYAKPDAGQLIVSPSEEHPMDPHDAFADDMVIAEGIARYSEVVTTEVTRVTATWAGLRTFAPDRTLVIGFDPMDHAFFWVAGQGGYGFQTCAGASRLAADLVAGHPSELPAETVAALSPARFRE